MPSSSDGTCRCRSLRRFTDLLNWLAFWRYGAPRSARFRGICPANARFPKAPGIAARRGHRYSSVSEARGDGPNDREDKTDGQPFFETARATTAGVFAAALLATLPLAARRAGAHADWTPRLHTPSQLTVGTGDPVYPPWIAQQRPGLRRGLRERPRLRAGRRDGLCPRPGGLGRPDPFDQGLAPGAKPYDFGIQQISVTEARAEIVTFSQVYYQPQKGRHRPARHGGRNRHQLRGSARLALGRRDRHDRQRLSRSTSLGIPEDAGDLQRTGRRLPGDCRAGQIDATLAALPRPFS